MMVGRELGTHFDDIFVQRIGSDGQPAAGWPVGGIAAGELPWYEDFPRLCADGTGGVFVAWDVWPDANKIGTSGVPRVMRVLPNGTLAPGWPAGGLPMSDSTNFGDLPGLASDGTGGAYVVWSFPSRIWAQHVTAAGEIAPGWPTTGLRVCTVNSVQVGFDAVADGSGGVVIAWDDDRERPPGASGRYGDIYAARLRPDGSRAPGWPAEGLPVCVAPGVQWDARLGPDGTGGAVIAWVHLTTGGEGVQRILGTGAVAPGWPANGIVVGTTTNMSANPFVASDGLGGGYLAWHSDGSETCWATHVQFDGAIAPGWTASGDRIGDPTAFQRALDLAPTSDGGAVVVYPRYGPGSPDPAVWGIYAQKLSSDGIVPVQLALRDVQATSEQVWLTWWGSGAAAGELRVERSEDGTAWSSLGAPQASNGDELSYEDRSIVPGARYGYRLVSGSGAIVVAATWVEVPVAARFALAGAAPNPAKAGDLGVRFSLAERGRGTLELLDVSGRRVAWRDVGALAPGAHEVRMAETASLAPGLYWLRLVQGDHRATARVAIVR